MSAQWAIELDHLSYQYGRAEAVRDLSLRVRPGRCFGLFGRNGAGKTTTIKCLLNLLRPVAGTVRVFGLDPRADEVAVKSRLAYVPDQVAFYPWMSVRGVLDYLASFRPAWSEKLAADLVAQFRLDERKKVGALSRGQLTQLALVGAIAAMPELLVLDEPTSGLDPIVRREFIETVIGAYQDADPGNRTVLVSTHLISEFEGLIDEFAIVDDGRVVMTMESDEARARYQKIRARFAGEPPALALPGVLHTQRRGRELELTVNGGHDEVLRQVQALSPEAVTSEALTLEEVFLVAARDGAAR
jgi:ABC-2 type transport system ATP-binding protein